ncbi:hypothetical protein C2S51_027492 [Perilla frutescens var. frutescens]|nr:hypothetical protein C2S51_027492 [Perilla frutescens var. frutescens]
MSSPKSDSSGKFSESVGSYSFIHDRKPRNGNSSSPDFVADAKRWLNHHGLEKGYSLDQLNVLDTDAKLFASNYLNGNAKTDGENKLIEGYCNPDSKNDPALCSDPLKHFFSHCKSNGDGWLLGFESAINDNYLLPNAHPSGLDSFNCFPFEQPEKLCSDLDSHWIGVKKIEPWWHAVDKDDLAAPLTSQTSSHHNKNCDHPVVQSMHVEKVSENCIYCFDQYEEKMMDKETKSPGKQGLTELLLQESDLSCSSKDGDNAAKVGSSDARVPNGDISRGELLEALCHSQTRAREAEKLAQEACDEKDRVIDLFFQQASSLFAYRQWLRILQLETLCLHLRSKDHITCFSPPYLLPWAKSKGVNLRKNRLRAAKNKADKQSCNICKCALAFAIGLGLAGAGLLLGWTIGWLFPSF